MNGDDAAGQRQHQQRRDAAERQAQAAVRALGCRPAGVQEVALDRVEFSAVSGPPLERDGEPRPAIELGRVASPVIPVARGVREVAPDAAALGVLVEPAAQAWPLPQQRLVRHLDASWRWS